MNDANAIRKRVLKYVVPVTLLAVVLAVEANRTSISDIDAALHALALPELSSVMLALTGADPVKIPRRRRRHKVAIA